MREVERRYTRLAAEIRAGSDGRTIKGYAAVFAKESSNLGGFVEQVDSRAFNKSKGDGWPDVVARFNHSDAFLLGTTAADTLRLSVDQTGLAYEVDVPNARVDVLELVQRGDVQKSSFAFRVFEDSWAATEQGFPMRTLHSVQLVDVAPVVTPAYPDTTAGLRSLASHVGAELDEVRALAAQGELRRLLVRTDGPKRPGLTAAQRRVALLARRDVPSA